MAPVGSVLAEQRALRSAQHFDALDVGEVERRGRRTAVIDLIDVEADARLYTVVRRADRERVRAEAPDRVGGVSRVCGVVVERRHELGELLRVDGVRAIQCFTVHYRSSHRNRL